MTARHAGRFLFFLSMTARHTGRFFLFLSQHRRDELAGVGVGSHDGWMYSLVVAFLLMMGPLIAIHELGHFIVAKLSGVRVLVFSLGFGPRLFGFRRGDTDYRISAIPLGGYVRMFGDDMTEAVEGAERNHSYLDKPYWKKTAIAFAGPLANVVLAWLLLIVLAMGARTVLEPQVGAVLPNSAAAAAGLMEGDRIVAVDGVATPTFVDMRAAISTRASASTQLTVDRQQQMMTIAATPSAQRSDNPFADGPIGTLGITPNKPLPILFVQAGSAGAVAGLQTQDRVVTINGAPASTTTVWAGCRSDATITMEITREGHAPQAITLPPSPRAPGTPSAPRVVAFAVVGAEQAALAMEIEAASEMLQRARQRLVDQRGLDTLEGVVAQVAPDSAAASAGLLAMHDRIIAVDGVEVVFAGQVDMQLQQSPEHIHVLAVQRDDGQDMVVLTRMMPSPRKEDMGKRKLGIAVGTAHGDPASHTVSIGGWAAIVQGSEDTRDMVIAMVRGISMLFTGRIGSEQVGGPLTMATLAKDAAGSGWRSFVELMALLSINLALLNLLPVPVLDGGHIMLFTIEAMLRRPLSARARVGMMRVGALFVVLLMGLALFNDFLR
jgi:regulator of sigma E protease